MEVIQPTVELTLQDKMNATENIRRIEQAYRICYRSEGRLADTGYNKDFIRDKINRGHESPLEHVSVSFLVTCDRGVTHELVRHRIASYSQESTRYCNYNKRGLRVILPNFWNPISSIYDQEDTRDIDTLMAVWYEAMNDAEEAYNKLIRLGAKPEEARSVLPNSTATTIIITANLREYRHIMKLRTSLAAHPQMREIAREMFRQLKEYYAVIFGDIVY